MRAAALLPFLAAACGPEEAAYHLVRTERQAAPAEVDDEGAATPISEPLEDWDVTGADPLTGTYAVETVVKARLVIPLEARLLHRLFLVRRGRAVLQRMTLCDLTLPSVEGIAELSIPPALLAQVRARPADAEGEFLSGPEDVGATWAPEVPPLVLGQDGADDDGDGAPGVTIGARAVVCDAPEHLHVSLRIGAAYTGTVVDADTLAGEAAPVLDFAILGWSAECLAAAKDLTIEVEQGSTFVARRAAPSLDADGDGKVSCAELAATAQ